MGEVVFHSGDVVLTDQQQNDDCIKCLEMLLKKAMDGEICGVAVALQYSGYPD